MNSAKIFQMIRLRVPKKLFEKTVVIFKGKNLKKKKNTFPLYSSVSIDKL